MVEKLGITPGPWSLLLDRDVRNDDCGPWIIEHGEECILEAVDYSLEIKEKNAHLIAAAPEMLEALIKTTIAMDNWLNHVEAKFPVGQILDSIKKATGKTWEEVKELINDQR